MIDVQRLHLTDVTPAPHLPWARPAYPVLAYLVRHPDGPVLIDTGVGYGSRLIDELYAPVHHDLDDALGRHGLSVDDITTVINSHLHFDHCGQNARFRRARIIVQRAEIDAAKAPRYTVASWAFPTGLELTAIDGDVDVAPGIRIVATPGHTPGHQSVVVTDDAGTRTIVCCQASWSASSFGDGSLGDDGWDQDAGDDSVRKLHALAPARVVFSHDQRDWLQSIPP